MYVPGKSFQPGLMFVIKAIAYPSGQLKDSPLYGRPMATTENIRTDWNGLPGTNTLAYFEHS